MEIDSYTGGAVLIAVCGLTSVAGLLITRKIVNFDRLRQSHEVGGYLLSIVGTLYAVLLGLIVVDAMQNFQTARDVTEREANALVDVYILSSCLPASRAQEVRRLCVGYGDQVTNVEWDKMDAGKDCSEARRMAVNLMEKVIDFEPVTENQKALYPLLVDNTTQVWQNRRVRLNIATNGLPQIEWVALIAGAVITVFFTFFFGLENLPLQITMTAMVSMLISLNIFLVVLFGYPFSGELCVGRESFDLTKKIFDRRLTMLRK